ncbi:hypothetical protein DMENIID0001_085940 [Sergentomyia squamirostris]
MEIASWQKLILHWVNTTDLLGKPSLFLDQTDLNVFFTEYRKLMMSVTIPEKNIRDFLKVYYPSFKAHFFDDDDICSADYLYIYCLLLHYSCVVAKDGKFQHMCISLTVNQQEAIANLFSKLVDKNQITRTLLKETLRTSAPQSSIEFMNLGSPIKTPKKVEPVTPSMKLHEERFKELISLRAQVETERYERNFLETQIKDMEEALKKADQRQKIHIVEIKQLKERLLYGDDQNIPDNQEKKSTLFVSQQQKLILQLEDKIYTLNGEIDALSRNRASLQQKNVLLEREVKIFREKSHEYQVNMENIQAELEEKIRTIADLESVNQDLKIFIKEIRGSNVDLNSTDNLDFSFGSSNSKISDTPENLANAVVDVQLREKESENLRLRTELSEKMQETDKISREIVNFMEKHTASLSLEVPKIVQNADNLQYVAFALMTSMEQLVANEAGMKRTLAKAEVEQASLVEGIAHLNDKCSRIMEELGNYATRNGNLESSLTRVNEDLNSKSAELESLTERLAEAETLYRNATREISTLKSCNISYEKIIEENESTEKSMIRQIGELKGKLTELAASEKQLQITNASTGKLIEELRRKITETEERLCEKVKMIEDEKSTLSKEVSELNSIVESLKTVKDHQNREISSLTEKFNAEKEENVQLKSSLDSIQFEKEELKAEVDCKIQDMKNLKEINRISAEKLSSLEEKHDELLKSFKNIHDDNKIQSEEKTSLNSQLKDLVNKVEELEGQIAGFEAQELEFCRKIDSLTAALEVSEVQTRKIRKDKSSFEKQFEAQKTQSLQLLCEIDSKNRKIDEMEAKHLDFSTEVEKLKASIEEYQKDLEESRVERQTVEEKYSKSQEEFNSFNDKLSSLTNCADGEISKNLDLLQEQQSSKNKLICELEEANKDLTSQLGKINETCIELREQLKSLEVESVQKKADIEEIQKKQTEELQTLQRALAETYQKNENLSSTLDKLEVESKQLKDDLDREACEKEKIKESFNNASLEIESLKGKLSGVEESTAEQKNKIQKLTATIEDLEKERSQLTSEMDALKLQMKEETDLLKTQLSDQKAFNKLLEERIKSYSDKEEEFSKKIELLQTELDTLKPECESLKQKLQEAEQSSVDLKNKVQELTVTIQDREKEHSRLTSEAADFKMRVEKEADLLKTQIEEQGAEKDLLQDKIKSYSEREAGFNTKIEVLERELNSLKPECETLKGKLSEAQQSSEDLKEDLQKLTATIEDQEKERSKLSSEMAALKLQLKGETDLLKAQLSAKEADHDLLQEKIKSHSEDESVLRGKLEIIQTELDTLKGKLSEAEQSNGVLKEENTNLNSQLTVQKCDNELLQQEIKFFSEKNSEFINFMQSSHKKEKSLRTSIEYLTADKAGLYASLETAQEELKELKEELLEKESTVVSLKASLEARALKNLKDEEEILQLKEKVSEMTTLSADLERSLIENLQLQSALEEKTTELEKMEIDRKNVNEKARVLLEKQQDFEIKCTQYEDRIKLLSESKTKAIDLLQKEISGLEKRNINLNEQLKVLEAAGCDQNDLQTEIVQLKEEIQSIESQNDDISQKLVDSDGEIQALQQEIKKLLTKKFELEGNLGKLTDDKRMLEESVHQKEKELVNMRVEMTKRTTELGADSERITQLLQEVEKYRSLEGEVKKLEKLELQEKEINEKLVNDNAILQAKLYKNRQQLEEKEKSWTSEREVLVQKVAEVERSKDETIYETRREMEGKLEKMKDKMKTLHNSEVDKLRVKMERECAQKVDKAEAMTKKLSNEIAILNNKHLELVKENTNLKRMVGSASVISQSSKSSMLPPMSLNMEDEEGEQFNNTYLKDMKTEPEFYVGRESIAWEELQRRNSKLPPHLRSQYAAQYGPENWEDDVMSVGGETNVHDDSMSSLLYAGQRKKVSGTTSYKRPGPPTPSKNGGRLSLGGTGEVHPRQILKEINESTKQSTPGTLRSFFGRRSLAKDEVMSTSNYRRSSDVDACSSKIWISDGVGGKVNQDAISDTCSVQAKKLKRKQKVSLNTNHLKNKRHSHIFQTQRHKSKARRMEKFNEFRQIDIDDICEEDDDDDLWVDVTLDKSAQRHFEQVILQKISETPFVRTKSKTAAGKLDPKRRYSTPAHALRPTPSSVHSSAKCSGGLSISERIPRSEVIKLPRRQLIPSKNIEIKSLPVPFIAFIIIAMLTVTSSPGARFKSIFRNKRTANK